MTVDRMKILPAGACFPIGGICKICGFSDADLPEDQQVYFRFSDVCGSHDCRIKAKVCDCKACQKTERQQIKNQLVAIFENLTVEKARKLLTKF